MSRPRDGMRLEGLVANRVVAYQDFVLDLLIAARQLRARCAQNPHNVFNALLRQIWFTEGEELPETLWRLDALVIRGRIEDIVEPALRLGKSLRLAQMHGDRQRDVKEQLPVVIGIRPVLGD